MVFTYSCFRRGKVTSGGLFLSWLLFTVCGFPEMLYWLRLTIHGQDEHKPDSYRQIAHLIWWPLCVVQLILHCSADPYSSAAKVTHSCGNVSPEVTSSFISRLTMWWLNDMCRVGAEKPLELRDLYTLNDGDRSSVLAPKWTKLWGDKMAGALDPYLCNTIFS
ncbi:hypothetical protein GCK32_018801, partial [Trichostrongylus colubriformis]